IERIAEDKGLMAPYSLIRAGDRIFFLAPQGFQTMLSSTGVPAPLGKEGVDPPLFSHLPAGHLPPTIARPAPAAAPGSFAYKSQAGTAGLFDKILCYDYALDRAAIIVQAGEYLASLAKPGLTLDGLDTISGSIDALTFSLDDVATSALSKLSAMDRTHKLNF